jgi:futalosine hydrolase
MNVLAVVAVDAERDALPDVAGLTVVVGGVGPAAAAAAAAHELAVGDFDLVLSLGIGGGFAPLRPGDIAVASSIAFADLGIEMGPGFVPISAVGLGTDCYDVSPRLGVDLADRTGGHLGTVLTVATVTGTAESAAALAERYPDAVAEGMEGAGVAAAAQRRGVAFGELRAVSNLVGPRDRDAWDIPRALSSLGQAVRAVLA